MKKIIYSCLILFLPIILNAQNWEQLISGTTINLHNSFFVSPDTGWVIGDSGLILHTTDGGTTWTTQTSNTTKELYGIYFVDNLTGYIVGRCATILKTVDAGQNWTIQHENNASFCTSNPYTHKLKTVVMENSTTGVTGGAPGIGTMYTSNSFITSLGGESLTGNFNEIHKVPHTNKIFTSSANTMKISDDFGKSWSTAANYDASLGTLQFGFYLHSNAYYVTNGLQIFKNDATSPTYWKSVYNSSTFYIKSMFFLNEQKGFFSTSLGDIYSTRDGGETWDHVKTGVSSVLSDITFFNDTSGYCVGDNGTILKYHKPDTNYNLIFIDSIVYNYKDTIIYDTVNVVVMDTYNKIIDINGSNITISSYPNPTSDKMTIESSSLIDQISLSNLSGTVLFTKNVNSFSTEINLHSYTPAIYIVKIVLSQGTVIQKIELTH